MSTSRSLYPWLNFRLINSPNLVRLYSCTIDYNFCSNFKFLLGYSVIQLCSYNFTILFNEIYKLHIVSQSCPLHARVILVDAGSEKAIEIHSAVYHLCFMHFHSILPMDLVSLGELFLDF